MVTFSSSDTMCLHNQNETAKSFLARTHTLTVLAALFERGVRARKLFTRIGIPRAVAMSTEHALVVWLTRQQPSVGELVMVLASMCERHAAREIGLVELYDESVIASESYDDDPGPLRSEMLWI